jgi:hypothetical protein
MEPLTFEDAAVNFTLEEWGFLESSPKSTTEKLYRFFYRNL